MKRIQGLDGLRAIAIIGIIIYHDSFDMSILYPKQ